jgi:hypothetical protein
MRVKQVSVFLENASGRLAAATHCLGKAGINIRALSLADTADFGVLRLIVHDPDLACQALKAEGFAVSTTDVIAVQVPDVPGGLAHVLDVMAAGGADIEYMYAFSGKCDDHALVIFRVEDADAAAEHLQRSGVPVAPSERVYAI